MGLDYRRLGFRLKNWIKIDGQFLWFLNTRFMVIKLKFGINKLHIYIVEFSVFKEYTE